MDRKDGDAERFRQPAQSVKSFAGQGISPVDRAEVDVEGRGDQARAAAEPLECRLGVVAGLRRPQVLAVLDESQLELVKFQLGDQSKGRLQRLPREAERATGDKHPTLLFRPHQGSTYVAVDSLLASRSTDTISPCREVRPMVAGLSNLTLPELDQRLTILPELASRR